MNSALEELRDKKASIREVARKFNVPRATLTEKFKGVRPVERKMGPQTMLPKEIEHKIVKCLFTLADAGFPITKQQLLDNVTDLMSKQGGTPVNRRPGDKWFKLFLARHPTVRMRVAQNITKARAAVSEENIRKWFEKTRNFCESNKCIDSLADPKRVYNLDETAFFMSPTIGKVMSKKGARTVYNVGSNSDRQCTTVLLGGNAAGQLAPPMVVFKNKIFPKNVWSKWPDSWGIGE